MQDDQVEDAENTANNFFVNESYGVTCLVLATQKFKISEGANWKVTSKGYSNFTQFWSLLVRVLKLLCFLRFVHEVLYFFRDSG